MAYNDGRQDKLSVDDLHKTTHYITPGQDAFLKRKVAELRRKAPCRQTGRDHGVYRHPGANQPLDGARSI